MGLGCGVVATGGCEVVATGGRKIVATEQLGMNKNNGFGLWSCRNWWL